jgi:hypothetical protein
MPVLTKTFDSNADSNALPGGPRKTLHRDPQTDYAEYAYPFGVLHQYADDDSGDEEMDTAEGG